MHQSATDKKKKNRSFHQVCMPLSLVVLQLDVSIYTKYHKETELFGHTKLASLTI